jgi:hypothetical protein
VTWIEAGSSGEAQLEVADFMMTRLRESIDGHRDFDDATTTEEYIVPVTVHPDGAAARRAARR